MSAPAPRQRGEMRPRAGSSTRSPKSWSSVAGVSSGKSTLARTTLVALALTHTPQEVQFFVIDFGGGSFTGLQRFTHISGVATRSEPDIVRRTVAEVTGLLNAREVYFRQNGIDSIDTYRQRRAQGLADDGYGDIFLLVDGWGTLRAEFEMLEPQIQAIAVMTMCTP